MKGHVIALEYVLTMFPQLRKVGFTTYRFTEDNGTVLVIVDDIAALVSNRERNELLADYVSHFNADINPINKNLKN